MNAPWCGLYRTRKWTGRARTGFQGYAHPVAALAPPYSGGAPDGLEPYPHDPDEAKRLLSETGWPEGRALKLAATSDVTAVAERLSGDFRDSLGIEVETINIPDEDLIAAQKTLAEKNLPLPFDILVHAWFDLAAGYPPAVIHREYFHTLGAFRAGPPVPEFEELIGPLRRGDRRTEAHRARQTDRHVSSTTRPSASSSAARWRSSL